MKADKDKLFLKQKKKELDLTNQQMADLLGITKGYLEKLMYYKKRAVPYKIIEKVKKL